MGRSVTALVKAERHVLSMTFSYAFPALPGEVLPTTAEAFEAFLDGSRKNFPATPTAVEMRLDDGPGIVLSREAIVRMFGTEA